MHRIKWMIVMGFALHVLIGNVHGKSTNVKQPVDYVDPMIGTSNSRWMFVPGPNLPFGMVKLSAENVEESGLDAGYEYNIENIAGFGHIHSFSYGSFLMMPTTGPLKIKPGSAENPGDGYRSRFNHKDEHASAGYYSVLLKDYNIKAELTCTMRAGFFRYTFPKTAQVHILFDFIVPEGHRARVEKVYVKKVSATEIEGFAVRDTLGWSSNILHFVAQFSKPFGSFGGWIADSVYHNVSEITGTYNNDIGAFVNFATLENEVIKVRTGFSLVSMEQARLNLETELFEYGWDFEAVHQNARNTWNELLKRIEIEGGSEIQKKKFYTNLYRAYSGKSTWSDVNGKWMDMCENVQQLDDLSSPMYGGDGFWGSHWNLNQLWSLLTPDIVNQWIISLLRMHEIGGWLPKGPNGLEYSGIMSGSPQIPFVVAAYQKGIRKYDIEKVYEAIKNLVTIPGYKHECSGFVGNRYLIPYIKLGYVPCEEGAVSITMEYAYQDWCMAQLAKSLGKKDDYEFFLQRAQYYKNVFDPDIGYIRPKFAGGPWLQDFKPVIKAVGWEDNFGEKKHFVEANSWQFTWHVPHDVKGLIELMGENEFNSRLEHGFENSGPIFVSEYVNHANQPNMQAAYLFNYSGKPWLTQKWVREIMAHYYGTGPIDGYPGDEDEGQMSSWYVMSAIGLFEMDGGAGTDPIYEIGSPIFDKITLHLDDRYYPGQKFVIETKNNSSINKYIQSAILDGRILYKPWIYHREVIDGGALVLEMGSQPVKGWGSRSEDRPIQDSGKPLVTAPYIKSNNKYFIHGAEIILACDTKGATIRYTLNGNVINDNAPIYSSPFQVKETTIIKMQAFKDGYIKSLPVEILVEKAKLKKPVSAHELKKGIQYKYYEGQYEGDISEVADIENLTFLDSGIVAPISIKRTNKEEYFAFVFNGYIEVPTDGIYTFSTKSNDGSRLYIHGRELVENDGLHWPKEEYGSIGLKEGKHPITLKYFQAGGGKLLQVNWQGPGIEKQEVPKERYFH